MECNEAVWLSNNKEDDTKYCKWYGMCKEDCPYPFGVKYKIKDNHDEV